MAAPRAVVASCMRNEGPFLLEWVAYHRAIGFDDVVVVTNDCTDGTDLMLDRLAVLGHVVHLRNEIAQDEPPQVAGMRLAMAHPVVRAATWMLHIDADEFLNVTAGARRLPDLLKTAEEADADVVALLWRPFGSAGMALWRGGSVLSQFTWCQTRPRQANAGHKSLFRPDRFGRCIDHMPKDPVSRDVRCVNALGLEAPNRPLSHPDRARYRMPDDRLTWDGACINHYAIRSQDVFLMKNDRGDGMALKRDKYFLNSKFFRKHNRNEVQDFGILTHQAATSAILSGMLRDPDLRELDRKALISYQKRRDAVLTPERVAEWTL